MHINIYLTHTVKMVHIHTYIVLGMNIDYTLYIIYKAIPVSSVIKGIAPES
jgi:hypothetical protein